MRNFPLTLHTYGEPSLSPRAWETGMRGGKKCDSKGTRNQSSKHAIIVVVNREQGMADFTPQQFVEKWQEASSFYSTAKT